MILPSPKFTELIKEVQYQCSARTSRASEKILATNPGRFVNEQYTTCLSSKKCCCHAFFSYVVIQLLLINMQAPLCQP